MCEKQPAVFISKRGAMQAALECFTYYENAHSVRIARHADRMDRGWTVSLYFKRTGTYMKVTYSRLEKVRKAE